MYSALIIVYLYLPVPALVLWKRYSSSLSNCLVMFCVVSLSAGQRVTPALPDSCQTSRGKITYTPMFFFCVIARSEAPSGRQWHFTHLLKHVLWHSLLDKINPPSLFTSQPLSFPSLLSPPLRDYHLQELLSPCLLTGCWLGRVLGAWKESWGCVVLTTLVGKVGPIVQERGWMG